MVRGSFEFELRWNHHLEVWDVEPTDEPGVWRVIGTQRTVEYTDPPPPYETDEPHDPYGSWRYARRALEEMEAWRRERDGG